MKYRHFFDAKNDENDFIEQNPHCSLIRYPVQTIIILATTSTGTQSNIDFGLCESISTRGNAPVYIWNQRASNFPLFTNRWWSEVDSWKHTRVRSSGRRHSFRPVETEWALDRVAREYLCEMKRLRPVLRTLKHTRDSNKCFNWFLHPVIVTENFFDNIVSQKNVQLLSGRLFLERHRPNPEGRLSIHLELWMDGILELGGLFRSWRFAEGNFGLIIFA